MERAVRRDDERERYEITVGDTVAGFAVYRDHGGAVAFTHTVVDDAYEGQGIGGELVRAALDDVRERGRSVVPHCSFVADWIRRHDGYRDLVDTAAG